MGQRHLCIGRRRRHFAQQRREHLIIEAAQHGPYPVGILRVIRSGIVIEAGGVRKQGRRLHAGSRLRMVKLNTPASSPCDTKAWPVSRQNA